MTKHKPRRGCRALSREYRRALNTLVENDGRVELRRFVELGELDGFSQLETIDLVSVVSLFLERT